MSSDPTSLDRLHDIVTPPPVPLWPPAPGWYYVIVLLFVLVLVLGYRGLAHWQRNRYRREALAEFARQEKRLQDPAQRVAALAALAELLKRVAVTAYPRAMVASLSGPAWFEFLDQTAELTAFEVGVGNKLAAAAYAPGTIIDVGDSEAVVIATSVRDWIKLHDVDRPRTRPSSSSSERSEPNEDDARVRGGGKTTS